MWSDWEEDRERVAAEQDAAEPGQASIALALGAWLALVIAFGVIALCVWGAALVNGAWVAPLGG